MAAYFGLSGKADIAVILFTIPDLLVNFLAGGALSAALIPEHKRLGHSLRNQLFFLQTACCVGLAFLALAFALQHNGEALVRLLAPGISNAQAIIAARQLENVLFTIPLTALAGVTTAYLQSLNRFTIPALATLIYNGILVVAIFAFLKPDKPLESLTVAIMTAAGVRLLSQLTRVPFQAFNWRSLGLPLLRRQLLVRYVQALGAGGLLMVLPVIARALASAHGEGKLALLNYASKLIELPLGVAVSVISVSIFPILSQAFARGQPAATEIRSAMSWIMVLSLSMGGTLFVFSKLFATLAFGWGQMSPGAVQDLARLFAVGVLALPLQGMASLLIAIFNAHGNTRSPLLINIAAAVLYLPVAIVFDRAGGLMGIMASLVIIYLGVMMAQIIELYWRFGIAMWRVVEPARMAGMLVATLGCMAVFMGLRDAVESNVLASLGMAVACGGVLLTLTLLLTGEGRTLASRFLRR